MTIPFPTYREEYDFSTAGSEITLEQSLVLSTDGVHRPILTAEVGNDTQAGQAPPPVRDLSEDELQRGLELALEISEEEDGDEKMEDEESDFDFGESDDEMDDEPILHDCPHFPKDDRTCYGREENLHNHIKLDHGLTLPSCPRCPEEREFASEEILQNHLKSAHGMVSCLCGKLLKKYSIWSHTRYYCHQNPDRTHRVRASRATTGPPRPAATPNNTPSSGSGHPESRSRSASTSTRLTSSAIRKKRARSALKVKKERFLERLKTDPVSLQEEQERLFQHSSALSPSCSPGGIEGIARFSVRARVGSGRMSPSPDGESSPILPAAA